MAKCMCMHACMSVLSGEERREGGKKQRERKEG